MGEGYDAAPGFVRAYNVRTGKIVWTFNTIPQPGEFGYDTWDKDSYKEAGGTNAWAGMSIDDKKEWCLFHWDLPHLIFTAGNRKGQIFLGTAFWPSMRKQVNANGIINWSITIYGIMIYRRHPHWLH